MMNLEIRNVEFINKGAELMLHAIIQRMQNFAPRDYRLVLKPSPFYCPYHKFSKLEIYPKQLPIQRMGIHFGDLMSLIPRYLRDLYGIVLDKDIDVVFDASGFAYGDSFGLEPTKNLLIASRRWKNQGSKLILLPQAFGPFTSNKIRNFMAEIIDNSEVIFARDRISYENLISLSSNNSKIKLAPDFTNIVKSEIVPNAKMFEGRFCIIPNEQMLRKASKQEALKYIPFMAKCLRHLKDTSRNPFILIHEGKSDLGIAKDILNNAELKIDIIEEENPLKIKEIIRLSDGILASRFHGLVSALSQGVPAVGTGWSHKYKMLYNDYGLTDGLLALDANESSIAKSLDEASKCFNPMLVSKLLNESTKLKSKSEKMWNVVFSHFE